MLGLVTVKLTVQVAEISDVVERLREVRESESTVKIGTCGTMIGNVMKKIIVKITRKTSKMLVKVGVARGGWGCACGQ